MRVRVVVKTPIVEQPIGDAVVRVYIEDTARIDQAAVPIAAEIARVSPLTSTTPVEIICREPTAQESFSLRVHVDRDGSGQVTPGDFVSTVGYPAREGTVEVAVQPV